METILNRFLYCSLVILEKLELLFMTFEKRIFSRFWLNFFFQIKKMFFFSFASNQFETNLTFLGQIPSPIQL